MEKASMILMACAETASRKRLKERLRQAGHRVEMVADHAMAWPYLESGDVWMVIVGRQLPGGALKLCREIRKRQFPHYVFTLLLTRKTHKDEFLISMEAGVDDLVAEPFVFEEILARVTSARRVWSLEVDLQAKNAALQEARKVMDRDLEVAARIQRGLLPERTQNLYGYAFDSLFLPCRVVGGDMFNYFPVDNLHVAFYLLDVSGCGISAAMLSVAVSKTLASFPLHEAVIRHAMNEPAYEEALSPPFVARELDMLFQSNDMVDKYFTMVYGICNKTTGEVRFTQAGHPHPIFSPLRGEPRRVGAGGLPVGLIPHSEYTESSLLMAPGDRLVLYSDGITECTSPSGDRYGAKRLANLVGACRPGSLSQLARGVADDLSRFRQGSEFADDISLMVIERKGADP